MQVRSIFSYLGKLNPKVIKVLLVTIVAILGFNCPAQFYTAECMADSVKELHNYPLALSLYKEKINSGDITSKMFRYYYFYQIACCYSMLGNRDSAFYYLNKSIELNVDYLAVIFSDYELAALKNDFRWDEVLSKVKKSFYEKSTATNKDIAYEFYKRMDSDQKYRGSYSFYQRIYKGHQSKTDSIWKLQKNIDSLNFLFLEDVIEQHGWPTNTLAGALGASAAFLILQHADLKDQKKYFDLIEKAAKEGEASLENLALLTDRILISEGKKQLYGTQLKINQGTGKDEVFPIEEEIDVDKRRSRMGMPPLAEYLKDYGIIYQPIKEDSLKTLPK